MISEKENTMRKNENVKKEKKTLLENKLARHQLIIQSAEKEIYENISQCLCLARLQLGNIDLDNKKEALTTIGEANLLIGKAVRDLRNLAKQLSSPGLKLEN